MRSYEQEEWRRERERHKRLLQWLQELPRDADAQVTLEKFAQKAGGHLEFKFNDWSTRNVWEAIYHLGNGGWCEAEDRSLRTAIRRLCMQVKEYYASHWRDDDTPEFECGYGTG